MKDNSQKRDTSIEEEVIIFLSMSSEEDRKFMEIPRKKRTVEQYARLMTICFYLGFKKVFCILLREAEKSKLDDEVTDRLGALRKEGAKTKRWIKDFLNGFSLPQFQSFVREYVEKLDKIDGKDFDFSKAK